MATRPRLTPAMADVRRAVREALAGLGLADAGRSGAGAGPVGVSVAAAAGADAAAVGLPVAGADAAGADAADSGASAAKASPGGGARAHVLVALSGGADSLALAAATAFEAPRAGLRAGAVIVDHGLQAGSAQAASRAAEQARELGLDPVLVRRVNVGVEGGPEAAARDARYAALADAAAETGARAVLLGHTLDDQAETVLLGLARGSGMASLSGMAPVSAAAGGLASTDEDAASDGQEFPLVGNVPDRAGTNVTNGNSRGPDGGVGGDAGAGVSGQLMYVRPLLGIRRSQTLQFCEDLGLTPWHDPQNLDNAFARVRVREKVLPVLEREIGPGIAEALARTAELAREDSEALDFFAQEQAEELADHAEAGLSLSVKGLANNPAALRQRIIRFAVAAEFGVSLSRTHTLEVARLVTDWRGQGPLHLPGVRVVRQGGLIVFSAAEGGVQAQR